MNSRQAGHRLQRLAGGVLYALGLLADGAIGARLLAGTATQLLLLLHVPVILLWAWGVNLLRIQHGHGEQALRMGRIAISKWSLAAVLLSCFTFPGFGPLAYSIALCTARFLRAEATAEMPQEILPTPELSAPLDLEVQPLIDVLHGSDLQMKRAAVAALSRLADAGALGTLRHLLSDAQPEIRSDASIALTRLEEELARALNDALERWMVDQANTQRTLELADQYYHYACSNVLDETSQRVYVARAADLVRRCIELDGANADLWLKLATCEQRLGEAGRALQDACVALQLCPSSAEAYLLAMELAFHLHAWETLISLAGDGVGTLPASSEEAATLQWWLRGQPAGRGGRWYG